MRNYLKHFIFIADPMIKKIASRGCKCNNNDIYISLKPMPFEIHDHIHIYLIKCSI